LIFFSNFSEKVAGVIRTSIDSLTYVVPKKKKFPGKRTQIEQKNQNFPIFVNF
jgi:hypothetical protein